MQTSIHRTALTTISLLFLLSGATAAVADEGGHHVNTQTQTLNATMTGGVANFGTQTYKVNGGQVAFAMVGGQVVDPSSATIKYTLQATQDGLTTRGSARVQFTGTTVTGVAVGMSGRFTINTIVPAAELPLGCSTNCQSALPYLFVASAPDVQMTIGGITQTIPQTLQIESPYFNPWGAPIVLAFADSSVVIAATYTKGTIIWDGTAIVGAIAGTLDTAPASGAYTITSTEREDLVAGTSADSGSISFSSMTPSSLNANGTFRGTSTIPAEGAWDCSAGIPGTCSQTGFQSTGNFTTGRHSSVHMAGTYSTTWGAPAIGCTSSVIATVSQGGQSGDKHQGD